MTIKAQTQKLSKIKPKDKTSIPKIITELNKLKLKLINKHKKKQKKIIF
jgi:hypothetical protein